MIPMMPRLKDGVKRPFSITTTPSQAFAQLLKKNEQLRVVATK